MVAEIVTFDFGKDLDWEGSNVVSWALVSSMVNLLDPPRQTKLGQAEAFLATRR